MTHSTEVAAPTTPTRVLFVSLWELGWKSWGAQLERYSENHPGLEAVHVRVAQPSWMRPLTRELPPFRRAVVSSKRAWEWQMNRTVARTIARGRFDVVFVSSQIMVPALIEPCQRAGAHLAIALDVTGPAYQRDLLKREVPASQTWEDERRIYRAAKLCAPMSSWIADSLQRDFAVASEQIVVTPPAVAVDDFQRTSAPRLDGSLPRLLFCGNDFERKGGPQLVRWHQELWAQKAHLHIASGNAPSFEGLTNVVRLGSVPHAQLIKEILPSSDVFCLPTRNDMSPFAVAEAQAAGLPTVSSRIGGLNDLVVEGQSGFLISPDDEAGFKAAIERLIDDSALRARMGKAARGHAEENLDAAKVFGRLLDRLVALGTTGAAPR